MARHPSSPILVSCASALAASVLVLGCARILGIEDAECDPTYASDCVGVASGTGGSGASASSSTTSVSPLGVAGAGMTASAASLGAGTAGTGASVGAAGSAGTGAAGNLAGAAAGGAGTGSTAESAASPLCQMYCDTVAANCTGTEEQYASTTACLAVCELLDPGNPGDTSGNTVQCRLGRAQLAASTGEASNYCFSAGPGGAGVCGSDCAGFCAVMTPTCQQLGSVASCLQACALVPDLSGPPSNLKYNTTMQSGNSLQCRLFHVSAASVDPVTHCTHAAGQSVCD